MNACSALSSALDEAALGATPSRALAAHLTTCAACATLLEGKRLLAQRVDRAIGALVGEEPPPGLAERIGARVSMLQPRRLSRWWLGVPVALALAASVVVFVSALGVLRGPVRATDVAALAAWRSPTATLLVSRSSVLGAPFTTYRRSSQ